VLLIALPLAAAAATQALARRYRSGGVVMDVLATSMVPIMMATLAVVVASQVDTIRTEGMRSVAAVPIFVAFLVVMAFVGKWLAHFARLDVPASRALTFSGATRNSLVVLPLALALPDSLSLAAVVVVTQTLVELIGMVVYVRAIPALIPDRSTPRQVLENLDTP
jgi:ACR3 family arsenite transporter